MRRRLERLRVTSAAGTATLEYIAAIALASVLLLPVVTTLTGSRLDGMAERAICLVKAALGGGGCEPAPSGQPPVQSTFDPKPKKCKISEHSEKVSSEVKIAFIKLGENAGFLQATYSDGTVTYTATDGAEVGVTGGFGAKLDIGKLERGAKVDFGAGLKFDYGSTWVFSNPAQAKAMTDQLNKYLGEQEALKHDSTGGYAFWLWIHGATDPPKPPTQQVSTVEVTADVTGKVGLSLPWDPNAGAGSSPTVPNLTLAEVGLTFGTSSKWTQITDTVTGVTTWTTAGEVSGQVSGQAGPYASELKGVLGSSMAITRNRAGQIIKVTLVTTREGKATGTLNSGQQDLGGKGSTSGSASHVTVTTTSLDVTSDAQRTLVNQWLQAQHDNPDAAVSPATYLPDRLVKGDPFQNLMYTNATVSNVQYDNVSDKQGFAAEVKLGVSFGIDLSLETTDSTSVRATYLDVPGADGIRRPVDFGECEAK